MDIKEKEKDIFDKLRKIDPSIVEDGIVNEEEYLDSKYKIVYIMKEVNGGSGWNLKDFLSEGGRSQTWDNVARWTEGLLNLNQEYDWAYLEKNNEKRRKDFLKKIGVINLKKTPGHHTSEYKKISMAAFENRNLIKKQVDLYNPDIIICCGTADDFVKNYFESKFVNWNMTKRGVQFIKFKEKIIVSFTHPEARIRDAYLYYSLIDAVHEILENSYSNIDKNMII
ncbi:MAG: hypothetical protein E6Z20_07125 [Finegoldia magna]|uniref:hypothetical protein n=1 Tax=Finegoldia sp. BIOML-A1 TaxID=2584649 RepID=UPI0012AF2CAD|nr:hypothetical protein [Finegoldia sp. BIOML-A1]MDU4209903.1 hypothetical protein [Finegoldia magna]MDU5922919.1 hypothetical protein [Finegoldia magna]MSB11330.1 hypothetical protein [Finegoldia sp. BIOML-A1]